MLLVKRTRHPVRNSALIFVAFLLGCFIWYFPTWVQIGRTIVAYAQGDAQW